MKAIKFTITALLLSLIFSITALAEDEIPEDFYVEIITTVLSESSSAPGNGSSESAAPRKTTPVRLLRGTASGLSQSKTVNRTLNVKDSDGNTLWYLSLDATFIYNGSSSECINCSQSAGANAQSWSISSSSCSRSGNYATATATAVHRLVLLSREYTRSVTLSCGPNGDIY